LLALAACVIAAPAQTIDPSSTPPFEASAPSASAGPASTSTPVTVAGAGEVTFWIAPDQFEAWFTIDEVLAGSPNTVVGKTMVVSGKITGEFANPQGVLVGPIQVDMSTLQTDNNFRNRALHAAILQTGSEANRFATFQATSMEGLPDQVTFGTAYDLAITGDLTIHAVTRPVTFTATVTPVSESRLEGTASVTLAYADFDIHILRLPPQVASVGELVMLGIDFVAEAE
jgi:polyisoprenoid-binding protein YceI